MTLDCFKSLYFTNHSIRYHLQLHDIFCQIPITIPTQPPTVTSPMKNALESTLCFHHLNILSQRTLPCRASKIASFQPQSESSICLHSSHVSREVMLLLLPAWPTTYTRGGPNSRSPSLSRKTPGKKGFAPPKRDAAERSERPERSHLPRRGRERACRSGLSAPRTCVRNPCLGWVGMLQKQLDRHCTALNLGVVCCASRPREEPGHQPAGRSQLLRVVTELGSPVLFSRSADVRREDNIRRIPRGSIVRGTSSFRVWVWSLSGVCLPGFWQQDFGGFFEWTIGESRDCDRSAEDPAVVPGLWKWFFVEEELKVSDTWFYAGIYEIIPDEFFALY